MRRVKPILFLIIILAVVFLIPSPLSRTVKSTFATLTKPLLKLSSTVMSGLSYATRIPEWIRENKERENQRDEYRRLSFEFLELEAENHRFHQLLRFQKRISTRSRTMIPAQVIGRSPGGWRSTIILDKGSKQDLHVDMPVMTPAGLLGKIVEVSPSTAKVKLITHPQFRVGALIQRTRHTGVVYGTVSGECRMKYLATDADIRPGDVVLTAGLSETFTKGLLIGEITDVWKEPGKIYKVAAIKLSADFDRLEEVVCVLS